METEMLEREVRLHQELFSNCEKAVLLRLKEEFRARKQNEPADGIDRILKKAAKVESRAKEVISAGLTEKMGSLIAKMDALAKKRDQLLSQPPFHETYAIRTRKECKDFHQQKAGVEKAKTQELAGKAEEASKMVLAEETLFQKRRSHQIKIAGHSRAKHLKFGTLQITEHATFRWRDRGLECKTLDEVLNDLDNADILYTVHPSVGDDGQDTWELKLECQEGNKALSFILDRHWKRIITILRNDDTYDHKKSDKSFACRGEVEKQKICGLPKYQEGDN